MVKIRHTIFYRHFLVARSKFRDPRNTKQKFSLRMLNYCLNGFWEDFEGLKWNCFRYIKFRLR